MIVQTKNSLMKSYPLGLDNPILVRQVYGSTRWALYWKNDFIKIATFPNQFVAYECRRHILQSRGYK